VLFLRTYFQCYVKIHELDFLFQDGILSCTMNGHKSTVSSLAVCDGVLYSGSWDGTIRIWSLDDHSPLAVLGEDMRGNVASVLSLAADKHMLIAAHENGCIKVLYSSLA
jgi:WD40 repeat protein